MRVQYTLTYTHTNEHSHARILERTNKQKIIERSTGYWSENPQNDNNEKNVIKKSIYKTIALARNVLHAWNEYTSDIDKNSRYFPYVEIALVFRECRLSIQSEFLKVFLLLFSQHKRSHTLTHTKAAATTTITEKQNTFSSDTHKKAFAFMLSELVKINPIKYRTNLAFFLSAITNVSVFENKMSNNLIDSLAHKTHTQQS